ncbi:MAG TPA: acyl carrier protein [Allosphingosinicella sp.]
MTPSLPSLVDFVARRVAERIGSEAARDHDGDLFELGLDSVDAVELTGEIEEEFGLEIDPALPFEQRSINRLVAALAAAPAQRPV